MDDINALRLHVNVIDFFIKQLNPLLIYRLYGHFLRFIGNFLRNWKYLLQPIEKVHKG